MKKLIVACSIALGLAALTAPLALAGSPHFVGDLTITRSGNTITVSGKEAGLGGETQVHIVLTVDAQCVNPGDKHPNAANKESFTAQGDFPVQNGRASFTLSVTPTFKPDCTPPMTLQFLRVQVCDNAHDLCQDFTSGF